MSWWNSIWTRSAEPDSHRLGRWGEKQAARYLRKQGYRILNRRIRFSRRDEIDLVASQHQHLVFIEVKTRSTAGKSRPARAVSHQKQAAQVRAASYYLKQMKVKPATVRFDIVEVIGRPGSPPRITHIENAFTAAPHRSFQW